MTATTSPSVLTRPSLRAATCQTDWLTAALRPAGALGRAAAARLGRSLTVLAGAVDMVVLDLSAASVTEPALLALALRAPGSTLSGRDRCLLVVGGGDALVAELDRHGVVAASCTALPENVGVRVPAPALTG